jgi:hypothetical protein
MLLNPLRLCGRLGALALAGLATIGCGACSTSVTLPRDAGVDAGRDAGGDAGRDAGRDGASGDAGRDGANGDAGRDPLWTTVPGNADGCVIEYARDSTAVYTPQWTACPAGAAPGCERLDAPGIPVREGFVEGELRVFVGFSDTITQTTILASHDAAVQAIRSPVAIACTTGFANVGGGRAVFSTWADTDAQHYDERQYVIAEDATDWPLPFARVNRLKASVADLFLISATTYAARTEPNAQYMELYEGTRSNVLRGATLGGSPEVVALVGRDLFWEAWGAGYVARIFHGTVDGASLFYETPDGSDLKGFGTDGVDMAWTQGYGPHPDGVTFDRYELWTSPYTTDPALLALRLVSAVAFEGIGAVGDGWYALGSDGSRPYELMRLSDGARKELPAPGDGFAYDRIPAIGGGLIAAEASRLSSPGFERTLFVTPIAALPDVP